MSFATVYNTLDALAQRRPRRRRCALGAARRASIRTRRRITTRCATRAARRRHPCRRSLEPHAAAQRASQRRAGLRGRARGERIYRGLCAARCSRIEEQKRRTNMAKSLNGNEDPPEPEGRLRGRVAGEPPLPLLRKGRGRRGPPGDRRQLQGDGRRRDRPRARSPRLPRSRSAIRRRASRSATPRRTSRPPSPARRTSTRRCTRAWRRRAREEGFDDIAEWFETLAKAEKSHAGRFQKMLDTLK